MMRHLGRWLLMAGILAGAGWLPAGCAHHYDDRYDAHDRVGHRDSVHDTDSRVGRAVDRALDADDHHDVIDRH